MNSCNIYKNINIEKSPVKFKQYEILQKVKHIIKTILNVRVFLIIMHIQYIITKIKKKDCTPF